MDGFCNTPLVLRSARLLYTGASAALSKREFKNLTFKRLPQFKVEDMTDISPRNIAMAVVHVPHMLFFCSHLT
jgi:hypothetical protein